MSFLNQLKSQANVLQSQQGRQQLDLERNTNDTEGDCKIVNFPLDLEPVDSRLAIGLVKTDVLDELAKPVVSQPSRFV